MGTVFLFSCLITLSSAQERGAWPRTFSGQPDFVFAKDEVLKANKERAENGEEVRAEPKPWAEVLNGVDVHPFRQARTANDTTAAELLLTTDTAKSDALSGLNIPDVNLPETEQETAFDIEALKVKLKNVAAKAAVRAPIHIQEINPQSVLTKIRIQTISTSPFKYAQINGKRLEEGQTLYVPLRLIRAYTPVEKAVRAAAPHSNLQSDDVNAQIDTAVTETLKTHQKTRQSQPNLFMANHDVAVTVKSIEPRIVTLDILGKSHKIELNYSF